MKLRALGAVCGSATTCLVLLATVAPGGVRTARPASDDVRLDVPVLLVPGWFDTGRDLADLRIRLLSAGLDGSAVRTLTFEDPTGSNVDHAGEIGAQVTQVLAETGADRVDIVAHSMGGLATRWYLNSLPDPPVRRIAFLGTPHFGTLTAHLAWGDGRDDMLPDSPFLTELNARPPLPAHVEAITVRTPIDTHVLPGESAILAGVEDHVVCCPTHPGLIEDEDVFIIVLDFLERPDGGHPVD